MRSILIAVGFAALSVTLSAAHEMIQTITVPQLHALWAEVTKAHTESEQLAAIEAFITALPRAGGRPAAYALTARDHQDNPANFSAPDLLDAPHNHIVTLHVEGQTFDYVPITGRCVSVLLQE